MRALVLRAGHADRLGEMTPAEKNRTLTCPTSRCNRIEYLEQDRLSPPVYGWLLFHSVSPALGLYVVIPPGYMSGSRLVPPVHSRQLTFRTTHGTHYRPKACLSSERVAMCAFLLDKAAFSALLSHVTPQKPTQDDSKGCGGMGGDESSPYHNSR